MTLVDTDLDLLSLLLMNFLVYDFCRRTLWWPSLYSSEGCLKGAVRSTIGGYRFGKFYVFWLDLELELDLELPSYTPAFDMSDSSSRLFFNLDLSFIE